MERLVFTNAESCWIQAGGTIGPRVGEAQSPCFGGDKYGSEMTNARNTHPENRLCKVLFLLAVRRLIYNFKFLLSSHISLNSYRGENQQGTYFLHCRECLLCHYHLEENHYHEILSRQVYK